MISQSPNDGFIGDVEISIEICNGQQYINNDNKMISLSHFYSNKKKKRQHKIPANVTSIN